MPDLAAPAIAPGSMGGRDQPVIDGDGVVLRPWRAGDLGAVLTAFADPAIQRWHVRSMDTGEARAWIADWPARWRAESGASWAVEAGGEVAGQIGLRRIDLVEGEAHISYWVLPSFRGRRIAPAALGALTGWAFGELGLHRLELSHSTANVASCRVAERAGFPAEGTRRGSGLHADGWHDMHLHGRISP